MPNQPAFVIGQHSIAPGTRATVDLPVSVMTDHTPANLSVHVIHGRRPGPTMFVSAAIHGDEVIGVEIVRRLLRTPSFDRLKGTLLAVPIVNSFGFMNQSRYLPDRRDLNRSFPGSPKGSLAARLAHIFMTEIVSRSEVGIDLHSAAIHRTNLPQIRVSPSNKQIMALAEAFGAPLILTAPDRDSTLRRAAQQAGLDILLYEAGEGLRFDELATRAGVNGILRVMHKLGMIPSKGVPRSKSASMLASSSYWQRAPAGGLFRAFKTTGDMVQKGDLLGVVSDPFGEVETEITASFGDIIIGRTNLPTVNEGDGLFHIAKVRRDDDVEATIDSLSSELEDAPIFDEDHII